MSETWQPNPAKTKQDHKILADHVIPAKPSLMTSFFATKIHGFATERHKRITNSVCFRKSTICCAKWTDGGALKFAKIDEFRGTLLVLFLFEGVVISIFLTCILFRSKGLDKAVVSTIVCGQRMHRMHSMGMTLMVRAALLS